LQSSSSSQLPSQDSLRSNNTLCEKIMNQWQEFGPLSGATTTELKPSSLFLEAKPSQTSWTAKDVRPSFPKTTLDFW
jgi:hypothetical protein